MFLLHGVVAPRDADLPVTGLYRQRWLYATIRSGALHFTDGESTRTKWLDLCGTGSVTLNL